jgi:hypothetical protein
MSKIFSYYENNVDYAWYDSSNVKYSELEDHDDKLKTLRVVFNNGAQYEYKDVDVMQYLKFREDLSQGKALNKYIKSEGYEYSKLEEANLDDINERLKDVYGWLFIRNTDDGFDLVNATNEVQYHRDEKLSESEIELVKGIIDKLMNKKVIVM